MLSTINKVESIAVQFSNENIPNVKSKQNNLNKNIQELEISAENKIKTSKEKDVKEKGLFNQSDINKFEKKLDALVAEDNLSIKFAIDEDTKKMILKVLDNETNEVIQQFPPEITLKIARIVARTLEQANLTDATV